MKKITIIGIFIVFLLIASFFASASILSTNKNMINSNNYFEKPEWQVDNYWKYFMEFDFSVNEGSLNSFSVQAAIEDMYAIVTGTDFLNNEEIFVMALDGEISGKLSLITIGDISLDLADFEGDFGGYAYVSKNTYGMKRFEFNVNGWVDVPILGRKSMDFVMNMNFLPSFDFFNFPIDVYEQPWRVLIENASLYSYVNIDIPYGEREFCSSIVFNDILGVNRTEPMNGYDTVVFGGTEWGYLSNLWYSEEAGFLVKIEEGISWDNGYIDSVFYLDLLETNYDVDNQAPNAPDRPIGPDDGLIKEDYSYETIATDPNLDNIYYQFDWGDGTKSEWLGPYPSGTKISATHKWYNKGSYSVRATAKDMAGLRSPCSEPLSVLIKGDPNVFLTIHRIEAKDLVDWDVLGNTLKPEWYYEVSVEGSSSPSQRFHNTNNGNYNSEWNHKYNWQPDKTHTFKADSDEVVVKIKLFDYDDFWEGDNDDLADISGCNHPDTNGKDDIEDVSNLPRGAIYHGTFDVISEELKLYDSNPDSNSDFYYEVDGYYITCGDFEPDNSIRYEDGIKDPENDAKVFFKIESDYVLPMPVINISNEDQKLRPTEEIQFIGNVYEGAPDYSYYWEFGDGTSSTNKNPKHTYSSVGNYDIKLTVTDKFLQSQTIEKEIEIVNSNPILTADSVRWTGDGKLDDTFTFCVHYFDEDKDNPTVKKIIIDETEKNLEGSGSNSDYFYVIKGNDLGKGSHSYKFYFEDGYGGSKETSEKSFSVKKVKTVSISNDFYEIFINFPKIKFLLQRLLDFKI